MAGNQPKVQVRTVDRKRRAGGHVQHRSFQGQGPQPLDEERSVGVVEAFFKFMGLVFNWLWDGLKRFMAWWEEKDRELKEEARKREADQAKAAGNGEGEGRVVERRTVIVDGRGRSEDQKDASGEGDWLTEVLRDPFGADLDPDDDGRQKRSSRKDRPW